MTIPSTTKLSVKELAGEIGKSPHFVYQMRACGFPMEFDHASGCWLASLQQAKQWISESGFSVVRGRGSVRRLVAVKGQP